MTSPLSHFSDNGLWRAVMVLPATGSVWNGGALTAL